MIKDPKHNSPYLLLRCIQFHYGRTEEASASALWLDTELASTSNVAISNLGTIGGLVLRVIVIFNPSVVWIVAPVVILTCSQVDYKSYP